MNTVLACRISVMPQLGMNFVIPSKSLALVRIELYKNICQLEVSEALGESSWSFILPYAHCNAG